MGWCVLAIEHDWRIRRLIRANLEALGFQVREAVSGQHGLQQLREWRPDLIVVDVELPGSDGLSLVDLLRAETSDRPVPIVVLSADPPDRQLLAAGYLQKPFAAPALLQQVRRALDADGGFEG